ncbi:alpha/beta hydrolase [Ilumatobacter sp.]|uniref:alpha/beta fold hydrolase n=2 Tax=Ilumatobacter sp. TaxID=1967498 RepID=UPI0032994BEE
MATYVLIPGAGGEAWYWHLAAPLLEAAGHRAVPVELPASDPDAGLGAYVAAALDAVGTPDGDVVVVGQSLGGFTAPIVAERLDAAALVFVAAMIPNPGETAGEWWSTSGFHEYWGDQEMDATEHFLHDLPSTVLQEVLARGEAEQAGRVMTDPFPLPALPAIPTRAIAATNDRFFPVAFMDRLIRGRLGVEPEHVSAGHLPALANPTGLVEVLLA